MSKYEEFLKVRPELMNVISAIRRATGRRADGQPDRQNDKADFHFWPGYNRDTPELLNDTWTPAKILLSMSHGYYGSSAGYNDVSQLAAKYVMRACNALSRQIADKAIELAEQDIAKAQQAAREEAKSVIAAVTP